MARMSPKGRAGGRGASSEVPAQMKTTGPSKKGAQNAVKSPPAPSLGKKIKRTSDLPIPSGSSSASVGSY